MEIVYFGTGSFGVPALEALLRAGHVVRACVSQPDRPSGRGRQVTPTPIHEAADRLGIPHFQTADVNADDPAHWARGAELGLVAAFGQKLGPGLLRTFPRGMINIHGSLLPRFRGAAPYQWAILRGETETGVTVFQLNERWDAGEIWSMARTPIDPAETADELHDRLAQLGPAALLEALQSMQRGERPLVQDAAQATRAPKLSKSDARLDFSQPAAAVAARVRGLWSWPAATCVYVGASARRETLQLARAVEVGGPGDRPAHLPRDVSAPLPVDAAAPELSPPGAFCSDLTVSCGSGRIRLLEVRPTGGKLMAFRDFVNGRRVAPGDRLEQPTDAS
ncbi:MAG: methionyl-tRNA formyltransferase [Planctomycetia bacterium]|nr:MAG: methionyl-tRNA formyltransferase [Planctomycetia bacterium]